MARIRSLKIGFFHNDTLGGMAPLDRLLFAGLWLIADRAGRLEDRPLRIKGELFPYESAFDCDAALTRLVDAGFIRRYAVDSTRLIQIASFQSHQKPHPKEPNSVLPGETIETLSKNAKPCNSMAEQEPAIVEPRKSLVEPGGLGDLGLGDLGLGGGDGVPAAPERLAPEIAEILAIAPFDRTQDQNETLAEHRGITLLPRGTRPSRPSASIGSREVTCRKHYGQGVLPSCAHGVCVPAFLGQSWEAQITDGADPTAYVRQFIADVCRTLTGPVGDDPLNFWRAQWKAKHGSAIPERSNRLVSEAHRALAILEGRQS